MIRPVRKNDERLTLVARRTILAIEELKENGIDFTDQLFWASVDDEGRVKFGDWHPGESPEYEVVKRIWNDPWLECNAKLAAVGHKIVFGASAFIQFIVFIFIQTAPIPSSKFQYHYKLVIAQKGRHIIITVMKETFEPKPRVSLYDLNTCEIGLGISTFINLKFVLPSVRSNKR